MSDETNITVMRRIVAEVFNERNIDAADQLVAPGWIDHNPLPGQGQGREGFRQYASAFLAAFPDMQLRIDDIFASGDRVAMRMSLTGTHKGAFLGQPPSGRRVQMTDGLAILRIADGMMTERWVRWDTASLLQQLSASTDEVRTAGES